MSSIEVARLVSAPHHVVWAALADLASHVTWMKDAVDLAFSSEQRRGVGTTMRVKTRVGPLQTLDVIEVTDWVEGSHIGVDHRGLVKGTGRLAARPEGDRTLVTWTESLRFPWWVGGPVTAWLARPVLSAIWRGNLRRLEESLRFP